MLVELVIHDLAVIEQATLAFGPGLNVITGETGAGKSLLIGALELLIGAKAKSGRVRAGATRASVEARFSVPAHSGGASLARWARRHMPVLVDEWRELGNSDDRELTLGRTLTSDGKTRAYLNGRPLTRVALAELSPRLFEIHGQNDHQKLHDPAEQLRLLDSFAGLDKEVAAYREARAEWLELVERALRLAREARDRGERLELARFQLAEICALAPDPEERTRLWPERDWLRHGAGLKEGLTKAVDELVAADDALLDRLRRVARFVESSKERVGALAGPAEEFAAALVHLDEAARVLQSLAERTEADPERLEAVEARLAEIERVERKYKLDCSGLAARIEQLAAEIEGLEADERSQTGLAEAIGGSRARVLALAGKLRRERKGHAAKLVRAVQATLEELGLANAEFDVRLGQRGNDDDLPALTDAAAPEAIELDRGRFGERGIDRIEFVLSANPGEPLQKLERVASGGETARVMLALRSVLAGAGDARSLLFDEIDAGVGGRLGPVVGEHLRKLAAHHQVLVVTHLPSIAAIARKHLRVVKHVDGGRTRTQVEELGGEARVLEIADMIAGGSNQETARAEARRLIGLG